MPLFLFIAIAIMLAILFVGHLAIYWFLISVFPMSGGHLLATQIVISILWISFVAAFLISQRYNALVTRIFYRSATVWLGFFTYLLLGACIYAIVDLFVPAAQQQIMQILGEALIGIAIAVGIYGILNASWIRTTSITVSMSNLPQQWKSRKAVFMSDLHLGQVRGARFAERIVAKIRGSKPDIVFIGGDLYDGVAVDAKAIIEPLSRLEIPLGIYFVTGNHEEFSDNSKYLAAVREIGIRTLMDEKITIDGVQLVGVDYAHTAKKEAFDAVLTGLDIDPKMPTILLKHVPSDLDIARKHGVALQLSGHTHRAQMFPFTFLAHWIFRGFDYGSHSLGPMQAYTSSGVGTWGPPLRVGTRSEIVEIVFR